MSETTGRAGLPYPEPDDPNDFPGDMQLLAERVAELLGAVPMSQSDRDDLSGDDLYSGRVVYNTSDSTVDIYDGDGWEQQASAEDLQALAADLQAHENAANPHSGSASHGDVADAIAEHEGADDPHGQYVLADGTRMSGWVPLHAGSFNFGPDTSLGPVFDIPSGEFCLVRVHLTGLRSQEGMMHLRVNMSNEDDFYLYGYTVTDRRDGTVTESDSGAYNLVGWPVANWANVACSATVTLYNTHQDSVVSFESTATRNGSNVNNPRYHTQSVGRSRSSLLVESLRLTLPSAGPTTSGNFWVEGYRPLGSS